MESPWTSEPFFRCARSEEEGRHLLPEQPGDPFHNLGSQGNRLLCRPTGIHIRRNSGYHCITGPGNRQLDRNRAAVGGSLPQLRGRDIM